MDENMKNPAAIVEFEARDKFAPRTIGAEMVANREAQEVQVAMAAAKKFPRDKVTAYNNIMNDCQRASLAEKAMYEYPRGGTMVTGPSIHLARVLARGWGNIKSGFKVLDENKDVSVVLAYCHDLETNYYEEKIFPVKHVRETKKGSVFLTDSRDIYELVANQAARRERSCILSVIPADVVEAAVEQCKLTLSKGSSMPLVDRVRALCKLFQEQFGVTAEMLEKFIGCKKEAFSVQSIMRLKNVYNSLKDGTASIEQYFDMSLSLPAEKQNVKPEKGKDEKQEPERAAEPEKKGMTLDDI